MVSRNRVPQWLTATATMHALLQVITKLLYLLNQGETFTKVRNWLRGLRVAKVHLSHAAHHPVERMKLHLCPCFVTHAERGVRGVLRLD